MFKIYYLFLLDMCFFCKYLYLYCTSYLEVQIFEGFHSFLIQLIALKDT
jgi:hypothetical protein